VYDYLAAKAEFKKNKRFPWDWIRRATDDEMKIAAEDLLNEADEVAIIGYLRIFRSRDFPKPPNSLFRFIRSSNRRVVKAAARAIGRLNEPEVRVFALQLLGDRAAPELVTELLKSSIVMGDIGTIESSLKPEAMDEDAWHRLGMAIRNLLKSSPQALAECSGLLFKLYENGPCSLCRTDIVKGIIALGNVPTWLADECLYDAEPDTAALFTTSDNLSAKP
jgi:hypothetical protein